MWTDNGGDFMVARARSEFIADARIAQQFVGVLVE